MEKTTLKKNKEGYGYKYTELAEIHKYLEENNMKYYQTIETNELNGCDYIMTYRYIDGKWEEKPKRGCKVVEATLSGKSNPAQEQGSALTYARRYSLLLAFGLATEDDDAESLTQKSEEEKPKILATEKQCEMIKNLYENKTEELVKILTSLGKKKVVELTIKEASDIISSYKKEGE